MADWFNDDWEYRIKITSDNTKVSASIKGLAFDLSIITSDDFWNNVKSDGSDIRITKGDGTTLVARDVISIDTTAKTGVIRFDTSNISTSADEDYYIYFGNSEATEPDASDTYGQYNAYSSFLDHYLPYTEQSGTSVSDRTGNERIGTLGAQAGWSTDGIFGFSTEYDGSGNNNRVTLSSLNIDTENKYTVLTWVKFRGLSGSAGDDWRNSRIFMVNSPEREIDFSENESSGFRLLNSHQNGNLDFSASETLTTNTFYLVAASYDGNICILNQDGESVGSSSVSDNLSNLQEIFWGMGLTSFSTGRLNGFLSESRFYSGSNLSNNDLLTLYNNESDNSSFWTIGTVEEAVFFSISTQPATDISYNSVTLNGEISDFDGGS